MMAAVGAPEVITQLESAAKVLMVRNSGLFPRRRGARASERHAPQLCLGRRRRLRLRGFLPHVLSFRGAWRSASPVSIPPRST